MPVIRPDQLHSAPPACKVAAYGIARFSKGQDAGVELHFHDGDELWYMIEGRIRVRSEGQVYELGPGEALFTEAGNEHELLEVLEDSVILWVEQDMRGQKRPGHLHRPEDSWP